MRRLGNILWAARCALLGHCEPPRWAAFPYPYHYDCWYCGKRVWR